MDFLDPRKRKRRSIRLAIGYFLMSIVVALGTVIIVYGAYGYGINTKTGQIIQNGLLFVDSQPGGAEIFLNGQDQHTATAARLVLQAGHYTLTLKRSGYRDWTNSFMLEDQSIQRFAYPFLFPVKPVETSLKNYAIAPPVITQSPDRRWLLVEASASNGVTFDQFDTTNLAKIPTTVTVPADLLSDPAQPGSISAVEWSTDNKNVLLKHTFGGGDEYIMFNRDQPSDSINVNRTLGATPSSVALRNKKADQVYVYDQSTQSVKSADLGKATLSRNIISGVLAFKPYGDNIISYVTDDNVPAGQVQARIWDGSRSYPLYTFSAGTRYYVDAARYGGHFYYVAGSNTAPRINIYKDPISDIKNPSIGRAIPLLALTLNGTQKVSFSDNAQFIEADSGSNVRIYDILDKQAYSYQLPSLAAPVKWMDGNRLMSDSGGQVFITDYDAANQQAVVATSEADGGYFSRDFNHLLTLQPASGGVQLVNVDMRAGSDLPKNLAQ